MNFCKGRATHTKDPHIWDLVSNGLLSDLKEIPLQLGNGLHPQVLYPVIFL